MEPSHKHKGISSRNYTYYHTKKRYFILKITLRLTEWLMDSCKWTMPKDARRLERENRKMADCSESSPFITRHHLFLLQWEMQWSLLSHDSLLLLRRNKSFIFGLRFSSPEYPIKCFPGRAGREALPTSSSIFKMFLQFTQCSFILNNLPQSLAAITKLLSHLRFL